MNATKIGYECKRCDDTGWVCEQHDDRPWEDRERACHVTMNCIGPGMPCSECNPCDEHNPPRLPEGFVALHDRSGDKRH